MDAIDQSRIRNFAIIAHIDHGKSTLADRLLELTHTVSEREMEEQVLDSNPIERERGITIKLAPVRMKYGWESADGGQLTADGLQQAANSSQLTADSNQQSAYGLRQTAEGRDEYILNLIDTPGHVDFSYEVSRSLAACEGAILVVDATQGIQAQTLANLYQARKHNLVIIPVINKIDLPNARIEETLQELMTIGFQKEDVLLISAKTGQNVEAVLEAVVKRIPPPSGHPSDPLRALVFSSQYDPHKGVVVFIRVVDGIIHGVKQPLRFLASGATVTPIEIGYFTPKMTHASVLQTGEVGYIATGLKDIRYAKVGDTITSQQAEASRQQRADSRLQPADGRQQTADSALQPANGKRQTADSGRQGVKDDVQPLPGYQEPKPMVFLGLFPVSADEFQQARDAMEKLRLSDSAFTFRPISSLALGNGFQCGFLGLLHAEVVQERLLREFDLTMIATAPSVEYQVTKTDGSMITIQSAAEFPDPSTIDDVKEPVMQVSIFSPQRYVGAIMQLCQEKRAAYIDLEYLVKGHAVPDHADGVATFTYLIPLSEMIVDFFDRLKSSTEGYASLDYEFFDYQSVDVVKLDILVNKEKVDAFSSLVVREKARERGKYFVEKLAEAIPRQQFEVPIQAAIGGQIIARSDVKAFRKDVIAKLYGGDRTRKDKLLNKQKKGKAKMKMIGKVEIPQSAFFAVLKRE